MASAYSVTQVNAYIKNMFAQDFALNRISVKGEVSNCKYHTSGHIYFTLKDGKSSIAAVMFAGYRKGLSFQMEEGQQVTVKGSVEVYERDGRYQLYAQEITREGLGDLFERFQKLRNELEEMGMFSPEYKKPIPKYAKKIGIVTASTGAAIQDIMNISARRNPYVQLYLYPALVQGGNAKTSITKGIEVLDQMGLDVLIVGRGGGSIEDLWAFNEEIVARAIFQCSTPVISAVGHETDVTIADYVADMRAPTPSAAAELAVFDYSLFEEQKELYRNTLKKTMERKMERYRFHANQYGLRLKYFDPKRSIRESRQRLFDLEIKFQTLLLLKTAGYKTEVAQVALRMKTLLDKQAVRDRHRLELFANRLEAQSPLKKIGGGYGFVTDKKDHRINSVTQVKAGDGIRVIVRDGSMEAVISQIIPNDQTKNDDLDIR
ncbi:exodeoxyribonuclease VII large subunit [Lacrimispora algidixylanolytica]|uniref:Exodeoxyribonuclease 7 large subunit n=1 Tax=Lacrimispora algidixylanolytica TaxID=94868 RepID=A0A419T7B9_9FIRM|nr:exodeoxyribonuclease VII large subunit [Lacrimispora algidixylanolytica]RKD33278.1 exodeoxyribonuclease VII large subunit [Lacrimispora algidixylanolytica]